MNDLIEKTLLKESIVFNGSISELKDKIRLEKERNFKLKWITNNQFKFTSNISLGTLTINYDSKYFDGINGYAKFTELSNGTTKIDLKTKLRIELYIFTIIPLLAFLVSFLTDEEIPLISIGMFPLIIFWFWFVFRVQEKLLFKKVKNYILSKI